MSNSLLYSFLRSPSEVPPRPCDSVSEPSGDEISEEWNFVDAGHANVMLAGFLELKKSRTLTDVSIQVGESVFPAHKCVLSSASPYFKAMFTCNLSESKLDTVSLNGLEPAVVELLIDYAYTASLHINKANVQSLLSASNLLEMLPVREACCQFLGRHMDESNVLGIQNFAEAHACSDLSNQARAYALQHFSDLIAGEEFVNMGHLQLTDLISDDDLQVEREETVFYGALRWYEGNPGARLPIFHTVLAHVRLPQISPYFLHDVVQGCSVIQKSKECMSLLEEAKLYHLLPDRRPEISSERTRPRRCAGMAQVIVSVGGEDDKVVLRSVEFWNPLTNHWKQLSCLPFAVSKHGLVVSGNNKMYMAGGEFPDGSASRSLWRYDPVLNNWQEMASMNTPRSELGLAMLDGYVYAVGGWEGSCRLDSVERYDVETNTWTEMAPLKMAVTSPAVVATDGCLYVSGGAVLSDGDGIELVQKYDTKKEGAIWKEVARMIIPRSGSASCHLDGYIYVIGGWHASTENTNKVERYSLRENVWSFVAPMNERRYRPGVAVSNGKIYVLGGEEGWDRYHDTIECYDAKLDKWETVGEMPSSRSWLSCVGLTVHLDMIKEGP